MRGSKLWSLMKWETPAWPSLLKLREELKSGIFSFWKVGCCASRTTNQSSIKCNFMSIRTLSVERGWLLKKSMLNAKILFFTTTNWWLSRSYRLKPEWSVPYSFNQWEWMNGNSTRDKTNVANKARPGIAELFCTGCVCLVLPCYYMQQIFANQPKILKLMLSSISILI